MVVLLVPPSVEWKGEASTPAANPTPAVAKHAVVYLEVNQAIVKKAIQGAVGSLCGERISMVALRSGRSVATASKRFVCLC